MAPAGGQTLSPEMKRELLGAVLVGLGSVSQAVGMVLMGQDPRQLQQQPSVPAQTKTQDQRMEGSL